MMCEKNYDFCLYFITKFFMRLWFIICRMTFHLTITMTFSSVVESKDVIIFWFKLVMSFEFKQTCLARYIKLRYFTFLTCLICSFKIMTLSNFLHNNKSRVYSFVKILYCCHNEFFFTRTNWKKSLIKATIDMLSKKLSISRFLTLTITQLLLIFFNSFASIMLISSMIMIILWVHNFRIRSRVILETFLFISMSRNEWMMKSFTLLIVVSIKFIMINWFFFNNKFIAQIILLMI